MRPHRPSTAEPRRSGRLRQGRPALGSRSISAGSRSFDLISIQEPIALGERATQHHVEARANGVWMTIATGTAIGERKLYRMSPVTADRVALVITEARGAPADLRARGLRHDRRGRGRRFAVAAMPGGSRSLLGESWRGEPRCDYAGTPVGWSLLRGQRVAMARSNPHPSLTPPDDVSTTVPRSVTLPSAAVHLRRLTRSGATVRDPK